MTNMCGCTATSCGVTQMCVSGTCVPIVSTTGGTGLPP
jgi:hypothetical protein